MGDIKNTIMDGRAVLGIELGSTRIKAVLVDEKNTPIASGSHDWENRLENGIWTYALTDVWTGLQDCYQKMAEDVKTRYGVALEKLGAIGFSAMMHGYLAFDKAGKQLVPFRTWRNTITQEAASKLTKLFQFNIPQRWSISHLYQAILNGEEHVKDVDYITTLDAYIHWQLTGQKVIGVGSASGMFPIDSATKTYYTSMIARFDELVAEKGYPWKVEHLLPKVLVAGDNAGVLTEEGAKLLDPTGTLKAGCPLCPPEGGAAPPPCPVPPLWDARGQNSTALPLSAPEKICKDRDIFSCRSLRTGAPAPSPQSHVPDIPCIFPPPRRNNDRYNQQNAPPPLTAYPFLSLDNKQLRLLPNGQNNIVHDDHADS